MSGDQLLVTAVEAAPRRPGELRVRLEGRAEALLLLADTAIRFQLRKGRLLPGDEFAAMLAHDRLERTRAAAWRALSRGPNTERTLRAFLRRRRHVASDIEQIVSDLAAKGFLDERALAVQVAEKRGTRERRGPRFVERELRMLGVSDEVVSDVTAPLDAGETQARTAEEALAKFLRRKRRLDREKLRAAAWRHLAANGFDADVIAETVDAAMRTLDATDAD